MSHRWILSQKCQEWIFRHGYGTRQGMSMEVPIGVVWKRTLTIPYSLPNNLWRIWILQSWHIVCVWGSNPTPDANTFNANLEVAEQIEVEEDAVKLKEKFKEAIADSSFLTLFFFCDDAIIYQV